MCDRTLKQNRRIVSASGSTVLKYKFKGTCSVLWCLHFKPLYTLNWNANALHVLGVFGSTEAGRDVAQMGASECIVGILIRLEV